MVVVYRDRGEGSGDMTIWKKGMRQAGVAHQQKKIGGSYYDDLSYLAIALSLAVYQKRHCRSSG